MTTQLLRSSAKRSAATDVHVTPDPMSFGSICQGYVYNMTIKLHNHTNASVRTKASCCPLRKQDEANPVTLTYIPIQLAPGMSGTMNVRISAQYSGVFKYVFTLHYGLLDKVSFDKEITAYVLPLDIYKNVSRQLAVHSKKILADNVYTLSRITSFAAGMRSTSGSIGGGGTTVYTQDLLDREDIEDMHEFPMIPSIYYDVKRQQLKVDEGLCAYEVNSRREAEEVRKDVAAARLARTEELEDEGYYTQRAVQSLDADNDPVTAMNSTINRGSVSGSRPSSRPTSPLNAMNLMDVFNRYREQSIARDEAKRNNKGRSKAGTVSNPPSTIPHQNNTTNMGSGFDFMSNVSPLASPAACGMGQMSYVLEDGQNQGQNQPPPQRSLGMGSPAPKVLYPPQAETAGAGRGASGRGSAPGNNSSSKVFFSSDTIGSAYANITKHSGIAATDGTTGGSPGGSPASLNHGAVGAAAAATATATVDEDAELKVIPAAGATAVAAVGDVSARSGSANRNDSVNSAHSVGGGARGTAFVPVGAPSSRVGSAKGSVSISPAPPSVAPLVPSPSAVSNRSGSPAVYPTGSSTSDASSGRNSKIKGILLKTA